MRISLIASSISFDEKKKRKREEEEEHLFNMYRLKREQKNACYPNTALKSNIHHDIARIDIDLKERCAPSN